jgi:hypothetical protein
MDRGGQPPATLRRHHDKVRGQIVGGAGNCLSHELTLHKERRDTDVPSIHRLHDFIEGGVQLGQPGGGNPVAAAKRLLAVNVQHDAFRGRASTRELNSGPKTLNSRPVEIDGDEYSAQDRRAVRGHCPDGGGTRRDEARQGARRQSFASQDKQIGIEIGQV